MLRVSLLCAGVLLPIVWHQYARGFSIPAREPPANPDSVVEQALAPATVNQDESGASERLSDQALADDPPTALVPSEANATGEDAPDSEPQPDAAVAATSASPEEPEAQASGSSEATDDVTIIVSEPSSGDSAAPAGAMAANELIHEVVPTSDAAKPMAAGEAAPRSKRAVAKAKRPMLALSNTTHERTQVRGLGDVAVTSEVDVAPRPTRQASIGGRGVAQTADLGRASPLSGAAPDVFAAGHHVVAAADCDAYADNPYFRTDAFGKQLALGCE